MHANFKITQFSGSTENGKTSGEVWMNAECFKMETPEMTTWYDGTTIWSMLAGSGEVNIVPPYDSNPMTVSPYQFLGIYKKGYKQSITKGTLRGEAVYTITLNAKKKNVQPQTIILDITQQSHQLLCIRALQDGDWTRIALLSYTDHNAADKDMFRFNASQYPNVEVIDLR